MQQMKQSHLSLSVLFLIAFLGIQLSIPHQASACLWDYDTLAMERQAFPGVLELITGKFSRHSKSYYEWRIKDRLARLAKTPNELALYDDLGVAYDKLGQYDKAIEVMQKKEAIEPGLYETQANLGTFYIHGGQLKQGLVHIEKAIAINPDAHFGREIYQALLIKYILKEQVNGTLRLPIESHRSDYVGFTDFVIQARINQKTSPNSLQAEKELAKALEGILGMMHFGNHQSPILLEVLAELLLTYPGGQDVNGKPILLLDAKRLAARAYLQASYQLRKKDPQASEKYRQLAIDHLTMQITASHGEKNAILEIEKRFKEELKEAEIWIQQIEADEKAWIQAGIDVDKAYSEKYYKDPEITHRDESTSKRLLESRSTLFPGGVFIFFAILVSSALLLTLKQRKKAAAKAAS